MSYSNLIIITLAMLFTTIMLTRIIGLRSFAKMSSIDFAITISVGSIISSTILNSSVSLQKGAFVLFLLFLFRLVWAFSNRFIPLFSNVFENSPLLLVLEGKILNKNLSKSGVSKSELMAKLRESNAKDLSSVQAVVFETTGDISVLHGEKELNDEILFGVNRN